MLYNRAQICEFTLGRVVRTLPPRGETSWDIGKGDYRDRIGHIIGFGLNCFKEVLITVKFADGTTRDIHPNNMTLFI